MASLYSWANLHGAKYRDFSASRAQMRGKARQRMQQAIEEERLRTHSRKPTRAKRSRSRSRSRKKRGRLELAARTGLPQQISRQEAAQRAAQQAAQERARLAAELAAQRAAQQAAAAQSCRLNRHGPRSNPPRTSSWHSRRRIVTLTTPSRQLATACARARAGRRILSAARALASTDTRENAGRPAWLSRNVPRLRSAGASAGS